MSLAPSLQTHFGFDVFGRASVGSSVHAVWLAHNAERSLQQIGKSRRRCRIRARYNIQVESDEEL